jgi:ABC-type multidrug transport system ATPase subunit
MHIELTNICKKYGTEWIFFDVNVQFLSQSKSALLGNNGSGKSTLLQIISGHVRPTYGKVIYDSGKIEPQNAYQYISFTAPAMTLPELLTIKEFLTMHHESKSLLLSVDEVLEYIGLQAHAQKYIENCSSGMKQRIKLAQAIMSNVQVIFLDEPTSNLDEQGIKLYHQMIQDFASNKTVIVSSNDEQEYSFCNHHIQLAEYKNSNQYE